MPLSDPSPILSYGPTTKPDQWLSGNLDGGAWASDHPSRSSASMNAALCRLLRRRERERSTLAGRVAKMLGRQTFAPTCRVPTPPDEKRKLRRFHLLRGLPACDGGWDSSPVVAR